MALSMGRNYTHRCFISLVYSIQCLHLFQWAGSRMLESHICVVCGIFYLKKLAAKCCLELSSHFRLLPFILFNFLPVKWTVLIPKHVQLQSYVDYRSKVKNLLSFPIFPKLYLNIIKKFVITSLKLTIPYNIYYSNINIYYVNTVFYSFVICPSPSWPFPYSSSCHLPH